MINWLTQCILIEWLEVEVQDLIYYNIASYICSSDEIKFLWGCNFDDKQKPSGWKYVICIKLA